MSVQELLRCEILPSSRKLSKVNLSNNLKNTPSPLSNKRNITINGMMKIYLRNFNRAITSSPMNGPRLPPTSSKMNPINKFKTLSLLLPILSIDIKDIAIPYFDIKIGLNIEVRLELSSFAVISDHLEIVKRSLKLFIRMLSIKPYIIKSDPKKYNIDILFLYRSINSTLEMKGIVNTGIKTKERYVPIKTTLVNPYTLFTKLSA